MENASKALLIAASVLIGVAILSMLVNSFMTASSLSSSYDTSIASQEIAQFNVDFEKLLGQTNITAQNIVSIVNLAETYTANGINVTVYIYKNYNYLKFSENKKEFLKNNSEKYFTLRSTNGIIYNEQTGRVSEIYFKPV